MCPYASGATHVSTKFDTIKLIFANGENYTKSNVIQNSPLKLEGLKEEWLVIVRYYSTVEYSTQIEYTPPVKAQELALAQVY